MQKSPSVASITGHGSIDEPVIVSIEEAITLTGFGAGNVLTALAGGLALFSAIIGLVDVSYALSAAQHEFHAGTAQTALMSSAYFIGNICSCHLLGFFSDVLGRRYVLIRGMILNFVMYSAASLLPGYITFLVFRFFSGFFGGSGNIAGYVYLAEMQPMKYRTLVFLVTSLFIPTSFIYVSALAVGIIPGTWRLALVDRWGWHWLPWRVFYMCCGIPSLIAGVAMIFLPESPKYLTVSVQLDRALKSLKTLNRLNNILRRQPTTFKVEGIKDFTVGRDIATHSWKPATMFRHFLHQNIPMFKSPHWKNTFRLCFISSAMFLSIGSVLVWMPRMSTRLVHLNKSNNQTLCETMDQYYAEKELKSVNTSEATKFAYVENLVSAVLQCVCLLLVVLFTRFLHIKIVVCTCFFLSAVSCLALLWVKNCQIIVYLLASSLIIGSSGFNGAISVFIQVFPTEIRGTAMCMYVICLRLGCVLGSNITEPLLIHNCSLLYIIFSLAALACTALFTTFPVNREGRLNSRTST